MRRLGLLLSLASIAAALPATALAGGIFFGFGGGAGDLSFDEDAFAANFFSDDSLVGEWVLGYQFDSKVVIEGGGTFGMSFDTLLLADYVVLKDQRVMVGYAFQPGERFSVVPKVGVSFWDLDREDGFLFPIGSQRGEDSGSDVIWRVSGEWRVAQRLHLYAAYSAALYDFGSSRGPSLGFKFQF